MTKYRKKPVVIEAHELTRNYVEQVVAWVGLGNIDEYGLGEFQEDACYIDIKTKEGIMEAEEGDYIIRGVKGEFYPSKPDIFEMTYELVEEAQETNER